jgi:hypothetical protein
MVHLFELYFGEKKNLFVKFIQMLDPFILYIMLEKVIKKREAKDPMSRMTRYIEGCQQCMSLFFYY